MDTRIPEILKRMTLKEKASLCSGQGFWHLQGIPRLKIPSIMVADGPHGLRKQIGDSDHLGMNQSAQATCFPTESAVACSWNRLLIYEIGIALGEECLQEDVQILLGPGVNIKRSPLCGRNFEYFSEDPFLTGELATSYILGVQSLGVGTSIKHFAANNQEFKRMTIDSVVDERTLREIYLTGFEMAIKASRPMTVMCAYNMLDGIYCSENHRLLTTILREQWGYQGIVISDWGAVNNRVAALQAGLELEMPTSGGLNDKRIIDAVNRDFLSEGLLDDVVTRLLRVIMTTDDMRRPGYRYNPQAHHELAKRAAVESAVLLKNELGVLPISPDKKVLFIGEFFASPRYQGSGSSMINPLSLRSAKQRVEELDYPHQYRKGYESKRDKPDERLVGAALDEASQPDIDVVVIFAGLTADYESEGFDRTHLNLPQSHNDLITKLCAVHNKVVVVLQNGAPVLMPWLTQVEGLFEAYLGGEAGGEAIIDLLYGLETPSGKLAETFPINLETCAASPYYPMGPHVVEYREGLYVGYRDYDTFNKPVLFPFGFGLSYTAFSYEHIHISHKHINCDEKLVVTVYIRNVGKREGAEIIQLYVHDCDATMYRPEQELKGFEKIWLKPGQRKRVRFVLDKRSFAYYNVDEADWHVESGRFEIRVGRSSRDIQMRSFVRVDSTKGHILIPDLRKIAPEYYQKTKRVLKVSEESFKKLLKRDLPRNKTIKRGDFSLNSTLSDIKVTPLGWLIYHQAMRHFKKLAKVHGHDEALVNRLKSAVDDMPLRSFVQMTGGMFTFKTVNLILYIMNGHYIRAIKALFYMKKQGGD